MLFDYFKVPKKDELKILEYGIFGAVVLRGLFIGLGAVALENFHQLLLGFAAILYVASYKIIFGGEGGDDELRAAGLDHVLHGQQVLLVASVERLALFLGQLHLQRQGA